MRSAALASLAAADQAYDARNRAVHDTHEILFDGDWLPIDPPALVRQRYYRTALRPEPTSLTIGEIELILTEVQRATMRLANVIFVLQHPELSFTTEPWTMAAAVVEDRFELLTSSTFRTTE